MVRAAGYLAGDGWDRALRTQFGTLWHKALAMRIAGCCSDYTEEAVPRVVHPRLDTSASDIKAPYSSA